MTIDTLFMAFYAMLGTMPKSIEHRDALNGAIDETWREIKAQSTGRTEFEKSWEAK